MSAAGSERLPKLLLMLSSDQDGEVVAAARAVGRCLREAGHDWHWFASRFETSTPEPEPEPEPKRDDSYVTDEDIATIGVMLANLEKLRPRDAEFINQMAHAIFTYGAKTFISPRQRKYLRSLLRQQQRARS